MLAGHKKGGEGEGEGEGGKVRTDKYMQMQEADIPILPR